MKLAIQLRSPLLIPFSCSRNSLLIPSWDIPFFMGKHANLGGMALEMGLFIQVTYV